MNAVSNHRTFESELHFNLSFQVVFKFGVTGIVVPMMGCAGATSLPPALAQKYVPSALAIQRRVQSELIDLDVCASVQENDII